MKFFNAESRLVELGSKYIVVELPHASFKVCPVVHVVFGSRFMNVDWI